ncbi:Uncharacterized protein Rs2_48134 [Raphanus sativus]|nr:Uncharacterized protein Rs2_48134 [Raphanus sativus]
MRKKQNRAASLDENRVCLEKILVNRRVVSGRDSVRSSKNPKTIEPVFFKRSSSSSSSDSSGFSSSSSDSFYRRTRSPPPEIHHPKPVRTTSVERLERPNNNNKVKTKALNMYSDLKKTKQPISPGGRLATFLNSIFTKKPNKTNTSATSPTTTCSSASSLSRSCLSKTTSSSEKAKRSVRFCPLDEDSKKRSSGHKTHNIHNGLYGNDERESTRHRRNFDTTESRVMEEENRRVIEAAKELIRTYQKNKDVVKISVEEEEDDDGASCASSDLFELDNLSVIGIDRYREELPVYETTRFNTNRVISR